MQEFLLSLLSGRREIPKQFLPIFTQLKQCGAIEKHSHIYKLSNAFMLARIHKTHSGIFAHNLAQSRAKGVRISGRALGLEQGDIVLLLTRTKTPRLIKVLTHTRTKLVMLVKKKGKIIGIDCKSQESIHLPFSQKSLHNLPKYCIIQLENANTATPHITQILGSALDPTTDERLILTKYKRSSAFSIECEQEANNLSLSFHLNFHSSSDAQAQALCDTHYHRQDLRDKPFITIDPSDAKDHDDAIFWDSTRHTLYVAIADVSEYVTPNSALDHAAKERCFSLYFPHMCYPMLPNALSQQLCSLRANEPKLTLVWEIPLDKRTLTPHNAKLYEAIITPCANISYEQANAIISSRESSTRESNTLESSTLDSSIYAWLRAFATIVPTLKANRLRDGFDFQTSEVRLELDSTQALIGTRTNTQTPSHSLIEEAMLLANVLSAQALSLHAQAGIYRTHEAPAQEKIYTLFSNAQDLGYTIPQGSFHEQITALQAQANTPNQREELDTLIIKSLKEARYTTQEQEHFGLGFRAYTHFTSPIRRYSDLLAHRLLKTLMNDFSNRTLTLSPHELSVKTRKHLAYLLESTHAIIPLLNEQERAIARAEAEFKDRKYAHYVISLLESANKRDTQKINTEKRASESKRINEQNTTIRVRVKDTQYPALCVVDSTCIISPTHRGQQAPHSNISHILQGAKIYIEYTEYPLTQDSSYNATLTRVDILTARIYAQILE